MSKITEWLKFYFVGFFTHGLSKEGGDRSFFNTLLGFVLTFIIVCCGLVAGYAASFGVQYDNSREFKEFLYSAFADDNGSNRIDLSAKDGYLSASVKDGERVNTLLQEGEKYSKNGYSLIVDTLPAATTYAEFTVKCKKADGSETDFAVYRTLSDEDKKLYTLSATYSGKRLDPAVKQNDYEEFLKGVESAAEQLVKLKSDLSGDKITAEEYTNAVYELYFSSYYGSFPRDAYGKAPTLRTYYLSPATYESTDKYLAVLDNVCFCSFKTDGGLTVEYSGYFNTLTSGAISGGNLTREQMQSNIDGMIKSSFTAASGLNFLVYVISLSRSVAIYALALILISVLVFMALKFYKVEFCPKYVEAIKIVGSFQLWSAVITFALTFALSFFLARGAVFLAAEILLLCVIAVRSAVYVVMELLAEKKRKSTSATPDKTT